MKQITFVLSLLLLTLTSLWIGFWGNPQMSPLQTIVQYFVLFIAGILSALLFPRNLNTLQNVVILLFLSAVIRIFLCLHPVSDDVNRYLWEGKITRHGINPYAITANQAPPDSVFRDHYWLEMNHKDSVTTYPPLAILIFSVIGIFSYAPLLYKIIFVGFDLAIICLILYLLHQRKMPLRLVLFYALNPIILFSFAAEGHFDSLLVFSIFIAVLLKEKKWVHGAWFFLALAVQIKVIAIILVPIFMRNRGWRSIWAAGPVLLIPSLFFRNHIDGFIEGLIHFGSQFSHNGSIHNLLKIGIGSTEIASFICVIILAVALVLIAIRVPSNLEAVALSLCILIVLSPTIHFWYLSWVLPFLFFMPSMAWLYLSFVMIFYFLTWHYKITMGFWHLPGSIQAVQWIPFFAIFLWQLKYNLIRLFDFSREYTKNWNSSKEVSIVVPIFNENANIPKLLKNLTALDPKPSEIILSKSQKDKNSSIPKEFIEKIKVIQSPHGRGIQIACGIEASTKDTILVLHADCTCEKSVIERITKYLNSNVNCSGGSLGQCFDKKNFGILLIECLNDFRALFLQQSFGDQGQFFRREFIDSIGGFPKQSLMEDVEISEQIEKTCTPAYLGGGILASSRRWQSENWKKHLLLVIQIVFKYRISKLLKKEITDDLYDKYYSKEKL